MLEMGDARTMTKNSDRHQTLPRIMCVVSSLIVGMGVVLGVALLVKPKLLAEFLQETLDYQVKSVPDFDSFLPQMSEAELARRSSDAAFITFSGNDVTIHCPRCNCRKQHSEDEEDILEAENEQKKNAAVASTTVKVLVAILTTPSSLERRSLLRLAYQVQNSATVSIRFVMQKPMDDQDRTLVALEALLYDDLILLDGDKDTVNGVDLFRYFATLEPPYDYVMQTDAASYVRTENLLRHVENLPRQSLYYDYSSVLPCANEDSLTWYLMSWDVVVVLLRNSSFRNSFGKSFHPAEALFYDHPNHRSACSHSLAPETILVRHVETQDRWLSLLTFFEKEAVFNSPPSPSPPS